MKNGIWWRKMQRFGKKLIEVGLTHSQFGNLSVRVNDRILISRRGSMLDELCKKDIVRVDLARPSIADKDASVELVVHRNIYLNTSAMAIIHAHSLFAVIQSLITDAKEVVPQDFEGGYLLNEIPIIEGPSGSKELADNAARTLKDRKGVIIKGHGTMAAGSTIEEAYNIICSIEYVCKVKYFLDTFLTHQE